MLCIIHELADLTDNNPGYSVTTVELAMEKLYNGVVFERALLDKLYNSVCF